VVVGEKIGNGSLVVFGDSQLFTNSVLTHADNRVLAANLMNDSTVYLDTTHWQPNTDESIRAVFGSTYGLFSGVPFRYVLVAVFVAAAIFILSGFIELRRESGEKPMELLTTHRTFNKEALERVEKDKERHGIRPE
jgi:hypothetical protein